MNISVNSLLCAEQSAIVPVFKNSHPSHISPQHEAILNAAIKNNLFSGNRGDLFYAPQLADGSLTFVIFIGMGDEAKLSPRHLFNAMFGGFAQASALKIESLQVIFNHPILLEYIYCEKAAEAAVLSQYICGNHKTKPAPKYPENITFVSKFTPMESAIKEGIICGENANISRWMVDASSEEVCPSSFAELAQSIGNLPNFECKVFGKAEIEQLGMNAFLAVSRGSKKEPTLTVMRYMGNPESSEILGLIGKGLTFDSGGYNMKSNCTGMNGDMGGAASVYGAVKSAAEMQLKVNVIGVVAACENMVSQNSYLPGEILYSMNGKTIEVEDTDCEGRLTLCDAITYAVRKEKITTVIDIATLTGSVLTATGNETAGMIANDNKLAELLINASRNSCEKLWRLPIDRDLMYAYNSAVADIKNCAVSSKVGAGCSMAGMFLEDFTENLPWAHLDVACAEWNRHIANAPKIGSSAFGTRLLYSAIKLFAQS